MSSTNIFADLRLGAVQNKTAEGLLRAARTQLDKVAENVSTDTMATDPTIARMSLALELLFEAVLELSPKEA